MKASMNIHREALYASIIFLSLNYTLYAFVFSRFEVGREIGPIPFIAGGIVQALITVYYDHFKESR